MKIVDAKEMTRSELQTALEGTLRKFVEGLEVPHDAAHVRRFYRALVHLAARGVLDNGAGTADFLYMVQAAWSKEQSEEALGEAVLSIAGAESAN